MRKNLIFPIILSIVAVMIVAIGVSKTFAMDIVSSPTYRQSGSLPLDEGYGVFGGTIYQDGTWSLGINYESLPRVKAVSADIDLFYGGSYAGLTHEAFFWNKVTHSKIIIYPPYDTSSFFYDFNSNLIVKPNGSNLDFYSPNWDTMTLGSIIQTIPKPSVNFAVMPLTIPVYIKLSDTLNGFYYQGTDGKPYIVDENFTVDAPYTDFINSIPLGSIGYNGLILAGQTSGSGSIYIPYGNGAGQLLDTAHILKSFNTFQNPKVYFTNSLGSVVSWDMNCMTQGYDSCQLNGGVFKCTDGNGNLSPGGETCGGTVDVSAPPINTDTNVPESCYDGIKNQDEVSIDYGGVCGGSAPVYFSGFTCTYKSLAVSPTPGTYGYDFGTLSEFSEDHFYPSRWVFDWSDISGDQEQYFEANGLGTGTAIYSGSLTGINANVRSDLVSSNTQSQYNMYIDVYTFSGSYQKKINYIAFKTNVNSASQGSVIFKDINGNTETKPLFGIGNGIAIAYTSTNIVPISVRLTGIAYFTFYGMEIGWAPTTYTQVLQCDNTEWQCKVNDNGLCTAIYSAGNARGSCGFVDNKCVPTTSLEDADWSYATGGNPYQNVNQEKELDLGDDIFSCDREGFAVFLCPVDVASKIWARFKIFLKTVTNLMYGISSLGSGEGDKSSMPMNILGFLIPTAHAEDFGKKLITPFFHTENKTDIYAIDQDKAPSYTGSDVMDINASMFTMGDNVKALPQGGIKGILAYSQWMLLLIGGISVFVLFLIAIG